MMKIHSVVLIAAAVAVGCNPSASSPPTTTAAPPAPPAPPPPAEETAQAPAPEPPAEPPVGQEPPPEEPRAGGRLAFIQCTPESRQAKGCTKELNPVCGQVDTGIRCIKPPCPSTQPQTFSNPCMACMEPKTQGYFPMSCEALKTSAAP